nr:DEAD/DEAH box helicase [Acidaminococcus timonensis]
MSLRPYQKEAVQAVENEWNSGHKRTLLVLPTGTGKTICFATVAKDMVNKGKKVLILAHRDELLNQAQDKIASATGLQCAKEKGPETSLDSFYRITVGSVQTLMRPQRLKRFRPDEYGTIIIDEAHHALAESYQRVLNHFQNADVLGVTATPERQNVACLGEYFDSLAYEYTLPQAIHDGYLCKIKALTIPLTLDIQGVKTSAGDYSAGQLGDALDPYLEQIATEMEKYCRNRKTVVFLPLVATAQKFRDILNRHGFQAAEVNGNSLDRAEILSDFETGNYNVLCNAMLLTEGWDCPSVDCVVMLRATKIRAL